jgi:hypothetical protein
MIEEHVRHKLEQELLPLHWQEIQLIRLLRKIRFGTIERLAVQDGVPLVAVHVEERVDFSKGEGFLKTVGDVEVNRSETGDSSGRRQRDAGVAGRR